MQVIEWPQFLESGLQLEGKLSSMTVGVFDGVHRGHQALIGRVVSHNAEYVPVVITFRENHKTGAVKLDTERDHAETRRTRRTQRELERGDILSFEKKTEILEDLGVAVLLVIDFTEEFRHMSGSKFLEILLEHGNVGFFAVGSNFRCGYKLDTDALTIQNFFNSFNIPVEIVPEVMEGDAPISSSRIRSCLASGDIQLAQKMLGRSSKN
jgi:riboflavin kinase/FMN adenylyltransferase